MYTVNDVTNHGVILEGDTRSTAYHVSVGDNHYLISCLNRGDHYSELNFKNPGERSEYLNGYPQKEIAIFQLISSPDEKDLDSLEESVVVNLETTVLANTYAIFGSDSIDLGIENLVKFLNDKESGKLAKLMDEVSDLVSKAENK